MRNMVCYGQTNHGEWCQEYYETSSGDARRRAQQLRRAGYLVAVGSVGPQITKVGLVRLTLVHIRHGNHSDTHDLPTEQWTLNPI